jgi:GTPase SAR1 family protein
LERLIAKTEESRTLIKDKDVLLMIGNTGSGKSTNILKFLGYDLKPGKFGKLTTLIPTTNLDQDHLTFYTSPEAKSCTRYINAVAIPLKMYPTGIPEYKRNLAICDTPGFGDSAGVEVDIANGVGMINALRGAKSVRVVVILPYESLTGDRMAGAIKMSEIISNLFQELTVLESIAIFFNRVPKELI